jgi:anaerobic selenocysteine-containing dehydrogenase
MLVVDEVNPVFALPGIAKTREALLKVPFIVSVGNFVDETSGLADLILPNHAFLEGWTDSRPESGAAVAVATLAPPAMPPLYQTRATADILLDVSNPGLWMAHCHIAEHNQSGMMFSFNVARDPKPAR